MSRAKPQIALWILLALSASGDVVGQIGFTDTVRAVDERYERDYMRLCPRIDLHPTDSTFSWFRSEPRKMGRKLRSEWIVGHYRWEHGELMLARKNGKVVKRIRCVDPGKLADSTVVSNAICCLDLIDSYASIWFYSADCTFRWVKPGSRGPREITGTFGFEDDCLVLRDADGEVVESFFYGRGYACGRGTGSITERLSTRTIGVPTFQAFRWYR